MSESPVLFIPHGGGPLLVIQSELTPGMVDYLKHAGKTFPRPDSLIVVSGHREDEPLSITSAAAPGLIYDYGGVPPESYELEYPAPGNPELAAEIQQTLERAGVPSKLDGGRGFDHGVFIPLMLMYPEADIPVVQISLRRDLDPDFHLELGRTLSVFSRRNIALIGSGMSFHNLRALFSPGQARPQVNDAFQDRIVRLVSGGLKGEAQLEDARGWKSWPGASYAHPREEHFIPFHLCLGAAIALGYRGRVAFDGDVMGMRSLAVEWHPGDREA